MAISAPKRLVSGSQLTASLATYYTTPANTRTIITKLTLTNTTGTPRTVDIHLIPSGGSATASNQVVDAYLVPANDQKVVYEAVGHVLEAGGFLQAVADAATAVTIIASGVEVVTGA